MIERELTVEQNRYRRYKDSVLWQVWGYGDERWFTIGRDESDVLAALEQTKDRLAKAEELIAEVAHSDELAQHMARQYFIEVNR